jgi:flavorubredoxin
MAIASGATETGIHEIASGIYRISTPVPVGDVPGGFTFNQYLVVDDQPLLFHTGPRRLFPAVRDAVARVLRVDRLRWIAFSHVEADECGSLNEWLAVAPHAAPVCGRVAAMTSIGDLADRAPRTLEDGETLALGTRRVTWLDAPHVPHGWECGFLHEGHTRTLLCGDLFTQPGPGLPALTEADILGPSEAFRRTDDYYAHAPGGRRILERLARLEPRTLACMHGSAWHGDGGTLLRALADAIEAPEPAAVEAGSAA